MKKIEAVDLRDDLEVLIDFKKRVDAALAQEECLGDCAIKGILGSEQDFSELNVENARFENCRLLDCSFKKSSFKNVSFRNCDFSGSRFEDAYFSQCEWKGCKALGSSFSQGVFKNILLADNNMKYTDFDGSQWRWAHWEEVDFTGAFITQSRLRDLEALTCDFTQTAFFKTPLKGLDLTSSTIEGIQVSDTLGELRGARLDPFQAAGLMRLLGIEVV